MNKQETAMVVDNAKQLGWKGGLNYSSLPAVVTIQYKAGGTRVEVKTNLPGYPATDTVGFNDMVIKITNAVDDYAQLMKGLSGPFPYRIDLTVPCQSGNVPLSCPHWTPQKSYGLISGLCCAEPDGHPFSAVVRYCNDCAPIIQQMLRQYCIDTMSGDELHLYVPSLKNQEVKS